MIFEMGINMDAEYNYLQMVIVMKDYMPMGNLKVMEFIVGKMVQFIEGNLKMELDMGMDHGFLEVKLIKEII